MYLYRVFARPVSVQYRARLFSETTIFYLLVSIAFRYTFPLLLVWNSDGFWQKEAQFREQPDIRFKKRYIVILEGEKKSETPANIFALRRYVFATFPEINRASERVGDYVPIAVRESELDDNHDGLIDRMWIQFSVPIDLAQNRIYSIQILLFFDYRLSRRVDLRMECAAYLRAQTWYAARRGRIDATLRLAQSTPFYHKGFDFRYNRSLISTSGEYLRTEIDDQEEEEEDQEKVEKKSEDHHHHHRARSSIREGTLATFDIEQLLAAYHQRDCKYPYVCLCVCGETVTRIAHWDPYISGVANPDADDEQIFSANLTLHFPEQYFVYECGFWYLIKWAMIQYIAVWLVIDWAVRRLETIVFDEYMVPTIKSTSLDIAAANKYSSILLKDKTA